MNERLAKIKVSEKYAIMDEIKSKIKTRILSNVLKAPMENPKYKNKAKDVKKLPIDLIFIPTINI